MSKSKFPSIPGFHALSTQIHTRDGLKNTTTNPSITNPTQPRIIILYAWGDANPKHVSKYLDGFRSLYPASKQLLVLSPILTTITRSLEQRAESMKPVIEAVYGPTHRNGEEEDHDDNVLVLAMSNTGGIAYASTLVAYFKQYSRAMPHRLLILDSTPGSTDLSLSNMARLSYALALGIAPFIPFPFVVTQFLSGIFLYIISFIEILLGRKSAGFQSAEIIDSADYCSTGARRLYLYGRSDRIISYRDIEGHVARARGEGVKADAVVFEGSGHVEHMRLHGEKYWGSIEESWDGAWKVGAL
ncbi:uncharacterized protein BDV14DRAFT_209417 [Aspergillus stella-maris]|uniref:uncharacterized protein n=1 Tax=Aspergillus stella-maris TaxID=1810926 RepID=UPI003CCD4181